MATIQDVDTNLLLKRSKLLSALSIVIWIVEIALIYLGFPFWVVLSVGVVGVVVALWDRAFIKREVENTLRRHSDPDVAALIAEEITITEYRKRKEAKNEPV